jgi:hypothetical protein
MNPATVKLGLFALDQIAKWVEIYITSKRNPSMTMEEADALVKTTQDDAVVVGDAWKEFRNQ